MRYVVCETAENLSIHMDDITLLVPNGSRMAARGNHVQNIVANKGWTPGDLDENEVPVWEHLNDFFKRITGKSLKFWANDDDNVNVTIRMNVTSVNIYYGHDGWLGITVGTGWKD